MRTGKSLGRGGRHEVWQLESRRIQSIGGSKGGQPARHGGERRKCAERSFQDQPGLGTDQRDQVAVTGWHSDVLTLVF